MVTTNVKNKGAEDLYAEFRNQADAGNISETLYALEKMNEFKIPYSPELYTSTISRAYQKATQKKIREIEELHSCISRVYSCAVESRPGSDLVSHKIPLRDALSRMISASNLVNDYHNKNNVHYDKAHVSGVVKDSFEKAIEIKLTRAKGFLRDDRLKDTQRELTDALVYSKNSGLALSTLYDEIRCELREKLESVQITTLLPGTYETRIKQPAY